MTLEYPYKLEPQESGGFVVQFLDVEEAFTEGSTPEECAFNAAEGLHLLPSATACLDFLYAV